jgi:hypothetical protein
MSVPNISKPKFIMLNGDSKKPAMNAICLPNNFFDNYINSDDDRTVIENFETPKENDFLSFETVKLLARKKIAPNDNHTVINEFRIPEYNNLISSGVPEHNNLISPESIMPTIREKILPNNVCMIVDELRASKYNNLISSGAIENNNTWSVTPDPVEPVISSEVPEDNNLIPPKSIMLTIREKILPNDGCMIIDELRASKYNNLISSEAIENNNLIPPESIMLTTREKILPNDGCIIVDGFMAFKYNTCGSWSGVIRPVLSFENIELTIRTAKHNNLASFNNTKPTTRNIKPIIKKSSPNGECCFSCDIKYSTLWRAKKINGDDKYLCNACGLKYSKGQYCQVCHITYYQCDMNDFYGKICSICNKWVHNNCLTTSCICKKCVKHS